MSFNELLDDLLSKQIILLGESKHGIREQNLNRVRLIKMLHERAGFNLLYLESLKPTLNISNYSKPIDFIYSELHEVYHTEEILELIEYCFKYQVELRGFELYDQYLEEYFNLKINNQDNGFESRTYRDKKMFDIFQHNFNLHREKAIIWGHNAHMSKKTMSSAYRKKVFGEYLSDFYKDRAHFIGQFTGEGRVEHLKGQEQVIKQYPDSIEEYIVSNIENCTAFSKLDGNVFNKEILFSYADNKSESILLVDYFDSLILNRKGTKPLRLEIQDVK